ncbi:MAG: ribbon-helix-helix domain-containing protein [Deltaproteobacteria bacterium]|nr:ribbon-helix-helix domain-containing protein [Deltaproteobacteria bacterium]
MARKKISTTVYITEEQNQRLKLLNQKTKVPIAEYIREGIDLVLKLHREQLPGQMSFEEDAFESNASPSGASPSGTTPSASA